jgi:hypothetical protein
VEKQRQGCPPHSEYYKEHVPRHDGELRADFLRLVATKRAPLSARLRFIVADWRQAKPRYAPATPEHPVPARNTLVASLEAIQDQSGAGGCRR